MSRIKASNLVHGVVQIKILKARRVIYVDDTPTQARSDGGLARSRRGTKGNTGARRGDNVEDGKDDDAVRKIPKNRKDNII